MEQDGPGERRTLGIFLGTEECPDQETEAEKHAKYLARKEFCYLLNMLLHGVSLSQPYCKELFPKPELVCPCFLLKLSRQLLPDKGRVLWVS